MQNKRNKLPTFFVLKSNELEKLLGSRLAIKRQAEQGLVQSIGSGFYASPTLDPFTATAIAVTKYYPQAVISNMTALYLHKLSDFAVEKMDVDILKDTKITNRLLVVHRVVPEKRIGISKMTMSGHRVQIYDIERALCEAYRIDRDGPIFFTAIKRYLKQKKPDFKKIKKYDEALGTKVLVHIMQEQADA